MWITEWNRKAGYSGWSYKTIPAVASTDGGKSWVLEQVENRLELQQVRLTFRRWTPDSGDIGTHPYRLNTLIKWRGSQEHQEALTCPIIIQHGIPHLNGTITNQIVTGVAIHEERGGGLWGGNLKPPPRKAVLHFCFYWEA